MRRIIIRLLKKYKYPPEQAKKVMEIVVSQAEKMCVNELTYTLYDRVAESKPKYE